MTGNDQRTLKVHEMEDTKNNCTSVLTTAVNGQNEQLATNTIMERRGFGRPTLKRNQSSFTRAVDSVSPFDSIDLSKLLTTKTLDTPAKELIKEDIKLVKELEDESTPLTSSFEGLPSTSGTNRFSHWECGFGFKHDPLTPSSIPLNYSEFHKAVQGELTTVFFVKAGLSRYREAINSGEHAVFPASFLENQNRSTEITLAQLDTIREHLEEVEAELEKLEGNSEEGLRADLQQVYSHAKPWIAKTRCVMIHSHVFYKTNYALAADARKEKRQI